MIITFSNNKGGVLKTTSAVNIASTIALMNKKVIMIDLDPQCNITTTFQKIGKSPKISIMDFLYGNKNIEEIIDFKINANVHKSIKNENHFGLIYGSSELINYESEVRDGKIKWNKLKELIDSLNKMFDYVIIDTPPALNELTIGALNNTDRIVIPYEPDIYSTNGLMILLKMLVQSYSNKKIFILPTKIEKSKSRNDLLENIKKINLIKEDNNIKMVKGQISYNNWSTKIIGKFNVPLVLSPSWKKLIDKYVKEYEEVSKDIIKG